MISDRLCVVPCGKNKIWEKFPDAGPTPAREVYIGGMALAARLYAEHFYSNWVILSARYGFLFPDERIPETYDTTFLRPGRDVISDAELKRQVANKGLARFDGIDVVAGRVYFTKVQIAFQDQRATVRPVLAGLRGMGFMLSAMKVAAAHNKPL